MIATSFSYYPKNSIFIVNPKLFLSKNIVVDFLKLKLLSPKVYENEKIKGIIKMEKKKSIFELAVSSIESHHGLTFSLIIFFPNATKNIYSFKIKSNWEFFRIVFSNKKTINMENSIICYPVIRSQFKKFNLNVRSNYFQKQTTHNSYNKIQFNPFLDEKKVSYKKNKKNLSRFYDLEFNLGKCLFEIFLLDDLNQINLKFFSFSRKISKKNFYRGSMVIHSFLFGLFFWIRIHMIFKKLPKNLLFNLLNKTLKKKYQFHQKINFEYYSILPFYQKII